MNEYLRTFQKLQEKDSFKGQQWFGERQDLVEKYSWAVPNDEALVYLSEFDQLIEVGAGNGYWAKCINDYGGNVRATDIDPSEETWHTVEQIGVEELDLKNQSVLTVWPPTGHQRVARKIVDRSPAHILYIGEPRGGCTGTSSFFDALDSEYGLIAKVDIPSYVGVNDNLFHYTRKR